MQKRRYNLVFILVIASILIFSTLVLRSIAPGLYPNYFAYLLISLIAFFIISKIDFEVLLLFSPHLYVFSIVLLILPLIIGQVTRGAVRWIPIGFLTLQPSEIVRPFLTLFFAYYLTAFDLDGKRLMKSLVLFFVPVFLILIQPSLGVSILTGIAFLGVLLASSLNKKYVFLTLVTCLLAIPIFWFFLAPYQKQRIIAFVDPHNDPLGAGYNSIQSMIAVGSGGVFGRGLGEGVQTQLAFLPERHTDFIFAATAEELGLVGAGILLLLLVALFFTLSKILENAVNPTARAFIAGLFLVLLAETIIHVGMNMGLLPITGVPLPLFSAGGSALLSTMISLAIAISARKNF